MPNDRLGLLTGDPYEGGCQKVVRLSRPSELIWRSCDDLALEFSPTGQRMVTTHILQDGPGPFMVQVRGARGHDPLHVALVRADLARAPGRRP